MADKIVQLKDKAGNHIFPIAKGLAELSVGTSNIKNQSVTASKLDKISVLNLIYPVGSIYMSVNNASPQSFFGGTWEQIKDKFILSAGSTYAAGTTGGSATINISHSHTVNSHNHSLPANTGNHKLTTSEIPKHTHTATLVGITPDGGNTASWGNFKRTSLWNRFVTRGGTETKDYYGGGTLTSDSTGGDGNHTHPIGGNTGNSNPGTDSKLSSTQSILPPYISVYVWKRIA